MKRIDKESKEDLAELPQRSCKSGRSLKSLKSYASDEENDKVSSHNITGLKPLKSVKSFSQFEGQPVNFVKSSFIINKTIKGKVNTGPMAVQKQNSTGQRKSKQRKRTRNGRSIAATYTARAALHNGAASEDKGIEPASNARS